MRCINEIHTLYRRYFRQNKTSLISGAPKSAVLHSFAQFQDQKPQQRMKKTKNKNVVLKSVRKIVDTYILAGCTDNHTFTAQSNKQQATAPGQTQAHTTTYVTVH